MKIALSGLLIASLAFPAFAEKASSTAAIPEGFDEAAWREEWNAHDTDGDGRISREEAIAGNPNVAAYFDMIDADGDGYITPEEDQAMLFRALRGELPED